MTLEEIRGLLEKATPGPWKINTGGLGIEADAGPGLHPWCIAQIDKYVIRERFPIVIDDCKSNAALIAAAPDLAALLVRAVEETRATTAELDRLCSVISDEDIAIVEPVVDSARSLLRELGVEA